MSQIQFFGTAVITDARVEQRTKASDGKKDANISSRPRTSRPVQKPPTNPEIRRNYRAITASLLTYTPLFSLPLSVVFAGVYFLSHDNQLQTVSLLMMVSCLSLLIFHQLGYGRPHNAPPLVRSWIPYIGHWYQFWEDPITFVRDLREKHGDIVAVRMAGIENIFVFDKDFVKTIMQRPEEELPQLAGVTSNGTFLPLMGENLPVTFHEQERMKSIFRRKMTPLAQKLTLDFGRTMQSICDTTPDSGTWSSTDFFYDTMIQLGAKIVVGEEMEGNPEFRDITMSLEHLVTEAERTLTIGWPLVYWSIWTCNP